MMPTKNPRINVTFEETTIGLLSHVALQKNRSMASIVRELTIEALEMREDLYLSKLADELDKDGAKTYSHTETWK